MPEQRFHVELGARGRRGHLLRSGAGDEPRGLIKCTAQQRDAAITDGAATGGPDMLAGYYVVEVDDADTATALAQQIPTARYGKVELRPVVEYEG